MKSSPHSTEQSEPTFGQWLQQAAAGDAFEYHRGFLALDIDETKSALIAEKRLLLRATAAAAYKAAEQGAVHLLQRRLASHSFSYLAIKRASRDRS